MARTAAARLPPLTPAPVAASDALGAAMQGYLGSFVGGGAPSLRGLPAWPPVGGGRVPRMQLDTPAVAVKEDPTAAECVLFDEAGYAWY